MNQGKFSLLLLLLCLWGQFGWAQVNFLGKPGLMSIPSAEWEEERPLGLTFGYLPDDYSIFTSPENLDKTNFYNARVTFTSFLEVNLSIAHRPDREDAVGVGDRQLDFRFRLLQEKKFWPAIVVGITPPGSASPVLAHDYIVATKNFNSAIGEFAATIGYGSPYVFVKKKGGFLGLEGIKKEDRTLREFGRSEYLTGFFGGLSYLPIKYGGVMLEYNTESLNAGIFIKPWDWLLLQGYTFEGKEWAFTAGGNFKLNFLPRPLRRYEKDRD